MSNQKSEVKISLSPYENPRYNTVYPIFFDSFRTILARSVGFVSQLEISYGSYARD